MKNRTMIAILTKVVPSLSVLTLVVYFGVINIEALSSIIFKPFPLIISVLIMGFSLQFSIFRWLILLKIHGYKISYIKLSRIVYISNLIGLLTIGAIGVDAARLYYINREFEDLVTHVNISIIFDRIFGFFGILMVGIFMFIFNFDYIIEITEIKFLIKNIIIISIFILFFLFIIVIVSKYIFGFFINFNFFSLLKNELDQILDNYSKSLVQVFKCIILSIAVHVFSLFTILILSFFYIYSDLTIMQYSLAGIISMIINQIPLTPSGIGIGESVFSFACRMMSNLKSNIDYGNIIFVQRLLYICLLSFGLISLSLAMKINRKIFSSFRLTDRQRFS